MEKYDLDKRIEEANIQREFSKEELNAPSLQSPYRGFSSPESYHAKDEKINILDIMQQKNILHSLIKEMNESRNIFGKGDIMGEDPKIVNDLFEQISKMSSMIETSLNWNQEMTDEWKKRKDEEYLREYEKFPFEFPLE